jgi:hypothetical protein
MPTIGRRAFARICARAAAVIAIVRAPVLHAADAETPLDRLAKLATYLSENSVPEALACFDPRMKDYPAIEADLGAIGAQTDVLCAIDVVSEHGEGEERTLDTDWFVELRSQADLGPVERRRERVQLRMKRDATKWKIVAMAPVSILDPIHIQ